MRNKLVLILFLLVLLTSSASATSRHSMPFGSFLTRPVKSAAELVAVVRNHPMIANLYCRHFGVARKRLPMYFGSLRAHTVTKPTTFKVWYLVGKRIIVHQKVLPGGTIILVDRKGCGVIWGRCGNPLTKRFTQPTPVKPKSKPRSTQTPSLPPPISPSLPPVVVAVPVPVVSSPQPEPVEAIPQIIEQGLIMPAPEIATEPRLEQRDSWPFPLLLVGVLFVHGNHHSPTPVPVPEPSNLIILAVGISWIIYRRRQSRPSRHR